MTGRDTAEARAARYRRVDVDLARKSLATYRTGVPQGTDPDVWRAVMATGLAYWVEALADDLDAVDTEDGAS